MQKMAKNFSNFSHFASDEIGLTEFCKGGKKQLLSCKRGRPICRTVCKNVTSKILQSFRVTYFYLLPHKYSTAK